jgi:hypothetical protein
MGGGKTGMEAMLRSLGLGEVLDAANQLAQSGAINKVIEFANAVGPILDQQRRIEAKLDALAAQAGANAPDGGPWTDYDWAGAIDARGQSDAGGDASGHRLVSPVGGGPYIEDILVREVKP